MNKLTPSFTQKDMEVIEHKIVYDGYFKMAAYKIRYRLFNGGWSQTVHRELMERTSAVGILLYDPKLDRVVLIEQIRPGALSHNMSPWLIEIVAGVYEPGEAPENVAEREAEEEAGCTVQKLIPICDYLVSPGCSNEHIYLYCGLTDASQAGGFHGLENEHEDIRAFTLSAEEAFAQVRAGVIKTSPAIVSLLWLELNRGRLRKEV